MLPAAIPFQGDLEEIVESRPPRFVRTTLYLAVSLFVALILIAVFVEVDMVVVGTGQLTTDTPPIVLQPMERSIIREVKVKVGEAVSKGQVLATLDPTFAQADMASLSVQERSLLAQARRLEAELNDAPFAIADPSDRDETLQATLDRQRRAEYASRLSGYDADVRRFEANIDTTQDDRALLEKQLEVAKDLEEMRATLMRHQTGSRVQYLDAQTVRMRTERDFVDAGNRLTELQHYLESKRAERQAFIDDWRRQIMEELAKARIEAAKIKEALAKAVRMHDLVEVVAPADGVVLDVAKRSVGSVLREAEPLVTLVPSNAALIADIKVNSGDVGYTKPGDEVVIKVDAFPYQRHGLLAGRLRSVSEESLTPNSQSGQEGVAPPPGRAANNAFHRAQVELTKTALEHVPDGAHLIPGMTLTAEIKVGSRSILSFFLYPITRGLDQSMREP